MNKKISIIRFLSLMLVPLSVLGLASCMGEKATTKGLSPENSMENSTVIPENPSEKPSKKPSDGNIVKDYEHISQKEAKRIMDTETGFIILDVRSKSEYAQGHIKDAIVIPDNEIAKRAEKELPNKDQLILVYCRSGRRSANAAKELVKMGYTNIKEFGGIMTWPYEIVK